MRRDTFAKLALACFGTGFLAFVVRGVTQSFFGSRIGLYAATPFLTVALVLMVVLLGVSVLAVTNVRPLESE